MLRRSLLFVLLFIPSVSFSQVRLPEYTGWVNDFANIIPPAQEQRISAICLELSRKTGAQLAVATVKSLEGLTVETYANELFEKWGIGQKGKDNGVLILLSLDERKIWIEVGYGLEPILPDGKVGGILDQYVVPSLSRNDFGNGLLGGAAAVALTIAEDAGVTLTGQVQSPRRQNESDRRFKGIGIVPIIIFIILMIVTRGRILPYLLFFMMMGGGRGGGGGFGGGGFGGGFGGFGGGSSGGGGAGRSF